MNDLFSEGTDLEKKLYVTIREYNSFDKNKLTELLSDSIQALQQQIRLWMHTYLMI